MKTAVSRALLTAIVGLPMIMTGLKVATTTPGSLAASSGVHVLGNQLYYNGSPIVPHGADRSGTEYACVQGPGFADGPTDAASVQAMQAWHLNAVRVPLNEDCWLGINGVAVGGATYQQDIVNWVNTLTSNGMLVILDLHWSAPGAYRAAGQEPMADADHSPAFWTSVANTFKSNAQVMFDLYNEPDPIPYSSSYPGGFSAWQSADFECVRDGCTATASQGVRYQTAGMQLLVDAVRATGATNVVMVGGIQYAETITQYLGSADTTNSYLPNDPAGQMTVSAHMYAADACSNSTCWSATYAPVAAKYPLVIGEMGDTNCAATNITAAMPWLDSYRIGYLGWNWGTDFGCQSLISSYSGVPTSPYGQAYQSHLASTQGSLAISAAISTPAPATSTPVPPASATGSPSGGLALTGPLSLSTGSVSAGGTVTASFTVQNQGAAAVSLDGLDIAARAPDGSNQDFGGQWNVSLAAGQSVTVQKSRTFSTSDQTGTWTIFASYQTADAVWHPQAPQHSLSVATAPSTDTPVPPTNTPVPPTNTPLPPTNTPLPPGAGLAVTGPLSLSATTVAPGGTVTASFTVQNQGAVAISLGGLDIAARTPSGANADFGGLWNLSLAPGQSVTVQKSRTFSSADPAGTWTIFASYQTADGIWHPQAPQLSLNVTAPPTSTPVPPASAPGSPSGGLAVIGLLSLSASSVSVGGTVTASFTVQNQGAVALSLGGLDVAARTPSGANADFGGLWNLSLAPGQSVTVQKSRTFTSADPAGTWAVYASYQTADGVWHPQAPQLSLNVS